MKTKIKILTLGMLSMALLTTSCNYLDVVPPEQPGLSDATSSHDRTLGFLYSCYKGVNEIDLPVAYLNEINASTDESTLPYEWSGDSYWDDYATDNVTPINQNWVWGTAYQFIGQCLLFQQELNKLTANDVSDAERTQWLAESKFLIAYYHFTLLRRYGPIPLTDTYVPQDTPTSAYNGRFHFDYCVKWISDMLDEAAKDLPATRSSNEWSRATSTICKAVKARLLLYAASPLWNGKFPYPTWQNKNFETPGYGKELVSKTYDASKWQKALDANLDALNYALTDGDRQLYDDETYYQMQQINLPYAPGISDGDYSSQPEEQQKFLKKVMMLRYLVTTRENEGNKEIIWGISAQPSLEAQLPHRILKASNGNWISGWSGVSPTLYAVEHFYTKDGKLPADDEQFTDQSQWMQSAGLPGRGDIINLNTNREPRFYAWMGFDGGDFGSRLNAGSPLKLQMRNKDLHGYNPSLFNRDHSVTGYLSQKFLDPRLEVSSNGNYNWGTSAPTILFRLAELYLNVAECYAALGQTDKALQYLNVIRQRAGVPALTTAMIDKSGMTLTEWVHNERFVELYQEGQRFFDIRRWAEGPTLLGRDHVQGLNAEVVRPDFNTFNTVKTAKIPVKWNNRMYLNAVFYNEVYKNPQLVQAPGYE